MNGACDALPATALRRHFCRRLSRRPPPNLAEIQRRNACEGITDAFAWMEQLCLRYKNERCGRTLTSCHARTAFLSSHTALICMRNKSSLFVPFSDLRLFHSSGNNGCRKTDYFVIWMDNFVARLFPLSVTGVTDVMCNPLIFVKIISVCLSYSAGLTRTMLKSHAKCTM